MHNDVPQPLSLKKNIAWNTCGCLFYQGCQWLTTIVVVWLSGGYDDAGVLALAMAVGNIFASISLYKMRTFQVSDVTNVYTQANYSAMRFITVGIAFAICVPYTFLTTQGGAAIASIILFLLFKTDEGFVDFLYGVDQRSGRMDYIGRSQIARGIVSLGAFSLGLWLTGTLIAGIGCMFVGCFLITLVYDLPHARRFDALRPRIDRRTAITLLLNGLPAVLAVVANIAVVSVSRQFLGNISGDEVLGIYASISTPAVLMQAAVGYLYTPMVGRLSEAWLGEGSGLVRFLGKMALLVIISLAACSIALIVVGPWLLALVFGESIVASLYIFPYSILCTALIALISLSVDILIVFRRAPLALLSCGAAFCVSLALAVPCIGAFGINGINVSIAASYVVGLIIACASIAFAIARRNAHAARPSSDSLESSE